jgi:glycosyltransferase involved in cell wall biosynthesis
MDKDLVSVCIPTFNGAQFIKQTLESVLGQTYDQLEIIIQDDGSTDNTLEIVRSFADPRITVRTSPENLGGASNWNAATSSALMRKSEPLTQTQKQPFAGRGDE